MLMILVDGDIPMYISPSLTFIYAPFLKMALGTAIYPNPKATQLWQDVRFFYVIIIIVLLLT